MRHGSRSSSISSVNSSDGSNGDGTHSRRGSSDSTGVSYSPQSPEVSVLTFSRLLSQQSRARAHVYTTYNTTYNTNVVPGANASTRHATASLLAIEAPRKSAEESAAAAVASANALVGPNVLLSADPRVAMALGKVQWAREQQEAEGEVVAVAATATDDNSSNAALNRACYFRPNSAGAHQAQLLELLGTVAHRLAAAKRTAAESSTSIGGEMGATQQGQQGQQGGQEDRVWEATEQVAACLCALEPEVALAAARCALAIDAEAASVEHCQSQRVTGLAQPQRLLLRCPEVLEHAIWAASARLMPTRRSCQLSLALLLANASKSSAAVVEGIQRAQQQGHHLSLWTAQNSAGTRGAVLSSSWASRRRQSFEVSQEEVRLSNVLGLLPELMLSAPSVNWGSSQGLGRSDHGDAVDARMVAALLHLLLNLRSHASYQESVTMLLSGRRMSVWRARSHKQLRAAAATEPAPASDEEAADVAIDRAQQPVLAAEMQELDRALAQMPRNSFS
jgi:hypothetical protein